MACDEACLQIGIPASTRRPAAQRVSELVSPRPREECRPNIGLGSRCRVRKECSPCHLDRNKPQCGLTGPNLHFSPPDGRSTRYDRQDFVALACRDRRTVQVRLRAPSSSRLVLTALSHFASPLGEKCKLNEWEEPTSQQGDGEAGGSQHDQESCLGLQRFDLR